MTATAPVEYKLCALQDVPFSGQVATITPWRILGCNVGDGGTTSGVFGFGLESLLHLPSY